MNYVLYIVYVYSTVLKYCTVRLVHAHVLYKQYTVLYFYRVGTWLLTA